MAFLSSSSFQYGLVKATAGGTIPATPAWQLLQNEQADGINAEHDWLEDGLSRPNGAGGGASRVNKRAVGSFNTVLCRGGAIDEIMNAAISSTGYTSKVAKGGLADIRLFIEKKQADNQYIRTPVAVSSVTISANYAENVKVTYEVVSTGGTTDTIPVPSATYVSPAGQLLTGEDVSISLGGLTGVSFTDFSFTIEQPREMPGAFGSSTAIATPKSGLRKCTGSVTFYREDFAPETALGGKAAIPIVINFSTGTNGYKVEFPACNVKLPVDDNSGALSLCTVEFIAGYDPTTGKLTDVIWSQA